jgi:hypothetical protein
MPLLDHFRGPISELAPATSIGSFWIVNLAKWINSRLVPYGYRAYAQVHLGPVEADLTEFEIAGTRTYKDPNSGPLSLATLPPPAYALESQIAEVFEIQIHQLDPNKKLVAVVEFASPANKDRELQREKFVAKCLHFLQQNVGVVVLDIVTNRRANLHNDIVETLGGNASQLMNDHWTYVSAYRPSNTEDGTRVEVWPYAAEVGQAIPELPMPIPNGPALMLDLEGTYLQTLEENGIVTVEAS